MKRDLVMEAICRELGKQIGSDLHLRTGHLRLCRPDDRRSDTTVGFALLIFDFAPGRFLTHVSNARREDMIKLFREHADALERGTENELDYEPPGRS